MYFGHVLTKCLENMPNINMNLEKIGPNLKRKTTFQHKVLWANISHKKNKQHLVGASNPFEKHWSNWIISPGFGVKIKNV